MHIEERDGYYDLNHYKHIVMKGEEFIADEEIGVVYRVIPDVNHGCNQEIELKTDNDEVSEVFGVSETLTINQFKELGGQL